MMEVVDLERIYEKKFDDWRKERNWKRRVDVASVLVFGAVVYLFGKFFGAW